MPLRTTWSYEIDEDLAPKQRVHLVLAGGVALHEALHGAGFVPAVVVDVHTGITSEALHDQVDERLEGRLLALTVVAPERVERRRRPVDHRIAEEVFEAVLECPWVRFDVPEHVERGGDGEGREAPPGLVRIGRNELVA